MAMSAEQGTEELSTSMKQLSLTPETVATALPLPSLPPVVISPLPSLNPAVVRAAAPASMTCRDKLSDDHVKMMKSVGLTLEGHVHMTGTTHQQPNVDTKAVTSDAIRADVIDDDGDIRVTGHAIATGFKKVVARPGTLQTQLLYGYAPVHH